MLHKYVSQFYYTLLFYTHLYLALTVYEFVLKKMVDCCFVS